MEDSFFGLFIMAAILSLISTGITFYVIHKAKIYTLENLALQQHLDNLYEYIDVMRKQNKLCNETKDAKDIVGIDKECIPIVNALNNLPGIETVESCCGHGHVPFRVWFTCASWSSLAILARCTDRNYSSAQFNIISVNGDTAPCHNFMLESRNPLNKDEMTKEINALVENIEYWSQPDFYTYFKTN